MHRHEALKDEDFVPDDAVDLGEQALAEDLLAENGAPLSYLWMVDASTLESNPPSSSSSTAAGTSKEILVKPKTSGDSQTSNTTDKEATVRNLMETLATVKVYLFLV